MARRRSGALPLIALLLAACSAGDNDAISSVNPEEARALCLNSACGAPRQIVDLPQLENLLVTDDGRLFVTGQENVYEILADGRGGFQGKPLFDSGGGSGIAQAGATLYFLHQDSSGSATDFSGLYALDLGRADAQAEKIFSLTGMTLPNGLVADPGRALYVTDGPIAVEPKIVRLMLDPADPRKVLGQETWLLTFPEYPNGLAIEGHRLYTTLYNPITVSGTVARIEILPDGAPGAVTPLFARGIMDDLNVYGDTLLVTDWQSSRLLQITLDGELLQETALLSFRQPSSVDVGRPPLFPTPVALATERYTGRGLWLFSPNP